mmetsp:Transcript_47537/g.146969  ORF Transcript_47537/g.146969 Transcript_47537/m.146969 type:complete len:360 (+) Transcript_47537:1401-2480(+)
MLDHRPRVLSGDLDGHHLRDLDRLLHLQQVGVLHNLLVVAEVLLSEGLVDVLDNRLRNLPHHLADLNLWHLDDPLLVDDVGDLDDLLNVLDLNSWNRLLHILDLHARDLLHHLPDLHLRHLDNVLLHLHHGYFVQPLHKFDYRLLHLLLHLLEVVGARHLSGNLYNLLPRHLRDLLPDGDVGDLDELLLQLDHRLLHVHHLALALLLGNLLHQVDDLHVRHLHENLLVDYMRDLDHSLAGLEHLDRDLFDPLLDFVACLLPKHLVRLHGRDLNDLLVGQLDYDRLLAVAHGNAGDLNDLLHLLDLMLVLHDRVLLHHVLPRHFLDHLVDDWPWDLVDNRLHGLPPTSREGLFARGLLRG